MIHAKARSPRGRLLAVLLAIAAGGAGVGQVQAAQAAPPPDVAMPLMLPVPLPVLLAYSAWPPRTASPAQPVQCPRHTKPRADCTPAR